MVECVTPFFLAPLNRATTFIRQEIDVPSSYQFVFLQPVFLLVAQRSLVQVDDILAVFRAVVLRRPVVRCL